VAALRRTAENRVLEGVGLFSVSPSTLTFGNCFWDFF
jgi:hypothetical protein